MICDWAKAFLGSRDLSGIISAICRENVSNIIFVLISEINSLRLLVIAVTKDFLATGSIRISISAESLPEESYLMLCASILIVSLISLVTFFLTAAVAPSGIILSLIHISEPTRQAEI